MTAATTPSLPVPSFDRPKMEDRKRSLVPDSDEPVSRSKRIKDESGALRMSAENEAQVEAYQKDAILRQMNEYKREQKYWQKEYTKLSEKLTHHDDHLRTIDAWFSQLLDEVRILAAEALPTPPTSATSATGGEIFNSALEFADNEQFSAHLSERSQKIKDAITDIFGRIPNASPEILKLQNQLAAALAEEKVAIARCQGLDSEKQQLTDRLETASYRYLKAEKAVERAKSLQVQKLERQAILGGNGEVSPSTSKRAATPIKHETNGELENGISGGESDIARKEAVAVADQRKKQLEDLEAENDRLTNELSAARTKVASLKDEDYAGTALFKTFKLQHDDVIKRVNDLEATNVQLREEAQKYQAERTQHRAHIEEDNRAQTIENESMIARIEVDLARIRNSRDELTSELAIRKSTDEEKRLSSEQIRELAAAKDIRITALESEVERLKLQVGEAQAAECDHSGMDEEALRSKLRTLENQYNLLSQELPSMETAWKKTQALAAKKVAEVANSEDLVIKLNAEKSKAEQKYFAAMKAKDSKESELRVLKSQNARSSEIVSQLKDADSKTRELVISLERQISEAKDGLTKLEQQQRAVDQKHKEATTLAEGLKKQIEELNTLATAKDKDCLAASKARREAEDALEQLKVRLEETKKSFETLRKTKATVNNSSAEDWRQLAICPVCTSNIRNTALKLCGHVFCSSCVKDLISNRSRKCPSCGKSFGSGDSMSIVLT